MSINSKNSGKSSSLKEKALSRLSKAFRRDDDFENVAKTLEIEIEKHEAEDPEGDIIFEFLSNFFNNFLKKCIDFDQVYSNPMFELSSNSEEILSLPPTPRNETSEEKIEEIQAEEIIEEEIISQEPLRVEINVLKPGFFFLFFEHFFFFFSSISQF